MKKYPGQKKIYGVYHKIINEIPAHSNYYELFAGSAQIAQLLLAASPGGTVNFVLNDLSTAVTDTYNFNCREQVRYAGITVKNNKAIDIIQSELAAALTNHFVFMDPPYIHSSRPTNTKLYDFEMTDADHLQLLNAVLQLNCYCMIIHPKCDLYDKMLAGWRKVQIKIRYNRKTSIECLYMNYPPPSTLQTDKYLGDNCWDRQRIKRKSDRLIKKITELPELERKYLMSRLQQATI